MAATLTLLKFKIMAIQIQIRRDIAANWTSENPTLASGEMGYETDTNKAKFGDGTTAWNDLPYFGGESSYLVWTVLLEQIGSNAPEVNTEIKVTYHGIVIIRTGIGTYKIVFPDLIPKNKLFITTPLFIYDNTTLNFISNPIIDVITGQPSGYFWVRGSLTGTDYDGLDMSFFNTSGVNVEWSSIFPDLLPIEIRVYP
jgi:hypothetical protein